MNALTAMDNGFRAWSAGHIGALVVTLMLCLLSIIGGRWSLVARYRNILRISAATCILLGLGYGYVRRVLSPDYAWGEVIQLHLCDMSMIMTAVALLTLHRFPFEFAYYFGIGGTIQALATPDLTRDFPSREFLTFFGGHGIILVGVCFLIGLYGLRPGPWAVPRMILAGNLFMCLTGLYNYLADTNYGYLCHKPVNPSLLDKLGPWPLYLVWMEVLGIATVLILHLPFLIARKRRKIISESMTVPESSRQL